MARCAVALGLLLIVPLTVLGSPINTHSVSTSNLLQHLEKAFSKERNWQTQDQKDDTYKYINDFFLSIKGPQDEIFDQNYYFGKFNATGSNAILVLKGSRWGTSADRVSLLGAHYDGQVNTPAVGDNGSGMAAMLEAAKMVASSQCDRLNSVIFVAFDWEEFRGYGDYSYGSDVFVNQHLVPLILEEYQIPNGTYRGAYILDTIMNVNSTPHSQTLPPGTKLVYPDLYKLLEDREFRGDFMPLIGRKDDKELLQTFQTNWNHSLSPANRTFDTFVVELPYAGRPSDSLWNIILRDFLRSDHANFWDYEGPYTSVGLPAVFISDTANFRGFMQQCYHQPCDDLAHVTSEQLEFLSLTATSLGKTLIEFGTESKNCA